MNGFTCPLTKALLIFTVLGAPGTKGKLGIKLSPTNWTLAQKSLLSPKPKPGISLPVKLSYPIKPVPIAPHRPPLGCRGLGI